MEHPDNKKRGRGFLKILDGFIYDIDKMKDLAWGYGIWCLPNINENELNAVKDEVHKKTRDNLTIYLMSRPTYCGWKIEESKITPIIDT